MYNEVINEVSFSYTDEKVKSTIVYISDIASYAESYYMSNRSSNNFWKLPEIGRHEVYRSVFRALLEVFGVVEKTQTFYTLLSKTED